MRLNETSEKLFLKYLDPRTILLPSEIHELSRILLDAYRQQTEQTILNGETSFFSFISEIIKKYYPYAEEIVVKKRVIVQEHRDILKWWKELMAVPSIQGVLLASSYSLAAPVLKLVIVTGYFVKEKWNKKSLRELIKALSTEITEKRSLKNFSERADRYEATMFRKAVGSADLEVDELAIILEEARRKIYWRVEERQNFTFR